jgi:hypothetical protein
MKQKTTPEQKPFDYNAKINSLTKAVIISINKDLNFVIKDMQKEIDFYKQRNNILHGKLGQREIELEKSLRKELSLLEESCSLIKARTETLKSNTRFINEIIFLKNRNILQRILNVQYKGNNEDNSDESIKYDYEEIEKLKEENKRLKSKYITSRLTLEAVLVFIVPDNCRKMVEETLNELNKK